MTEQQDKNELEAKLQQARLEVSELKKTLNELSAEKEELFQKKKSIRDQIKKIIDDVKNFKIKRNTLTTGVKALKDDRDRKNREINDKIEEIKKLKEEYKNLCKKHNVDRFPREKESEIKKLEFALETQVMSFEKEQKLMKEIKALKKERDELKEVKNLWDRTKALSKEIDSLKSESNKIHKQVQQIANESQQQHESLITESKKIADLKAQEEEIFKKFLEKKNE
ncbi:MAG: hypothetical protein V1659_02035, partial [Candidatus Woesearchaeota archaeon]